MRTLIANSSPKATKKIQSYEDNVGTSFSRTDALYTLRELHIGQSLLIELCPELRDQSARNAASDTGRATGKKFMVIRHNDENNPLGVPCLEIARIG